MYTRAENHSLPWKLVSTFLPWTSSQMRRMLRYAWSSSWLRSASETSNTRPYKPNTRKAGVKTGAAGGLSRPPRNYSRSNANSGKRAQHHTLEMIPKYRRQYDYCMRSTDKPISDLI